MDLAEFGGRLRAAAAGLSGEQMKRVMGVLGVAAKADAAKAARADLGGDLRFSGWRRAGDMTIDFTHTAPGEIELAPAANTVGPWTVAERGRGHSNPTGFQGPGVQRRTGLTSRNADGRVRAVRATQGRKWSGYTNPKHTVADYLAVVDRETPARAGQAIDDMLRGAIDG